MAETVPKPMVYIPDHAYERFIQRSKDARQYHMQHVKRVMRGMWYGGADVGKMPLSGRMLRRVVTPNQEVFGFVYHKRFDGSIRVITVLTEKQLRGKHYAKLK